MKVDLQDGDAEVGTGPKGFAGAATPEGALGGIEGEEIVLDGANVDQAGEQKVRQLDKHAEVGHLGHDGLKCLAVVGTRLHFEIFEEL